MWRGVGDLASCDGGFKGQTIGVVTTRSPSDDVWPVMMMSPEHESRAGAGVTRQTQGQRRAGGTRLVIAGSD